MQGGDSRYKSEKGVDVIKQRICERIEEGTRMIQRLIRYRTKLLLMRSG